MAVPVGTPVVTVGVGEPAMQYYPAATSPPADAAAFLQSLRLPKGVAEELQRSSQNFPLRIFVVDNSGSMSTTDGHRVQRSIGGKERVVACSRWEELADSLRWHAELAARLGAQTEFRLLNPPGNGAQQVVMAGVGHPDAEIAAMEAALGSFPTGRTPLCEQVREVVHRVQGMAAGLRASGAKVCVVIASDGAATDGDIQAAMRPLQALPVWVVVRLCTDDASVVE